MNDSALIQAVQSNDDDALQQIVDRYYRMVYGICFRMTGNAADADELAHDAFVEAYLKIGRLRDAERFPGWLRTLTLNVCRQWHRQRRRLMTTELDENTVAVIDVDDSRHARMYYGMSRLSAAHRMVLTLHYFEGLSYDEIARFLDTPQGTVMSRLHRARNLLKEELQQMTEDYDIPENADIRFKEEVQAETALLLSINKGKPSMGQRLRIIFEKSPERLVQLIEESDETMQQNIAIALPRLGGRAISDVVTATRSSNTELAERAKSVLHTYVSRCSHMNIPSAQPDMPTADAYILADGLISSSATEREKAEALFDWLHYCKDTASLVMFTNTLLTYRKDAFDLLMREFVSDGGSAGWVRHALVRTGNPFCRETMNLMASDEETNIRLGLQGFDAIVRSLMHPWIDEASPEKFIHELRNAERYPPLREEDVDSSLIEQMKVRTAELLRHEEKEIRNLALNILGQLSAGEYLSDMRTCLNHPDQSTRLSAIHVLSSMQDESMASELMERAQHGPEVERVAAVKSLGQMGIEDSVSLLMQLVGDDSKAIRRAAIGALGGIFSASAIDALKELMKTADAATCKTVAKALYGGTPIRAQKLSEVEQKLAEIRRRGSKPVAFISLDAAIGQALPEIRQYDERDLTDRIACLCEDYCTTRRNLIEHGLMTRSDGTYEFTELGKLIWRVEHSITRRPEFSSQ